MKKIVLIIVVLYLLPLAGNAQKTSFRDRIPDDIKNTKVFKRLEWFYTQRAFPYDTIPLVRYAREMASEIRKIKNNRFKSSDNLTWHSIGPKGIQPISAYSHWGVMSGRVRSVVVHPTDPLTVYIGAASGGIWKTTDGGENWMDIGKDLESLSFGVIAIDPVNPDIIYAGTGESIFMTGFNIFNGKGLFKSTNGGQNWIHITDGFGEDTHFSDLAVSPYNSNILLAALGSGYIFPGDSLSNEGIWRSSDGGMTWSRTLETGDAFDVAFHPVSPDLTFAAVGGINANSGFYISTDQGLSWTQSNSGLQSANTIGRMQFDISPSDPAILYSVIWEPGQGSIWTGTSRAYKSVNGGAAWTQISAGINLGGNSGGWMDQGMYDLCIAVDPVDPDHTFIGNIELHQTTNGSTFSPVRPFGNNAFGSLVHFDYHKLVFAPSNPSYLYIGCDGGLYKSTDAGQTASSKNAGLETLQFYRVASHPSNPDIVFGGMQDNSNAMTFDGGITWTQNTTGDGMECFFDYLNPDIVYASVQNGHLTKSNNGGVTFPMWIYNAYGAFITPFFMHPVNDSILYTANKSIIRSTKAGKSGSWVIIADNVAPVPISTMAQSRVDPNNMIFATGGGTSPCGDSVFIVKISTDGGFNWIDVTSDIPGENRWVSRVVPDPLDTNTMYVLRTGFSPGNKVWKTTDLGQTWCNLSGDLPDLPCNDLFIDPEKTNHLYVANDIGVYGSVDGGSTWNFAGQGTPFVPAIDFDYVKIDTTRYLRVGTYGRSVYETRLDINIGIAEHPEGSNSNTTGLIRCHPNPFSTSSTLDIEMEKSGNADILIFDQLGKIVDKISQFLHQGSNQVIWNAGSLPPGIYFCRIRAENEEGKGKMVVIK